MFQFFKQLLHGSTRMKYLLALLSTLLAGGAFAQPETNDTVAENRGDTLSLYEAFRTTISSC